MAMVIVNDLWKFTTKKIEAKRYRARARFAIKFGNCFEAKWTTTRNADVTETNEAI